MKRKSLTIIKKNKIIFIIIGVLIIIRLILPYVVLRIANQHLAEMHGYYGKIKDIGISLYRGAYQVNDLYLNKVDTLTNEQTRFYTAKNIDLSVEWAALFHGAITGEVVVNYPTLTFTKDKVELKEVLKDTATFRQMIENAMPLKINRLEINKGSLHYEDLTTKPKIDISLSDLHVLAKNLKNVEDTKQELPSTVSAQAHSYDGSLTLEMKLNALAESVTFDLNSELKNVNLVKLNEFLKAYGNFDVNKGNFGLYTEMAAKDGKFKGYVKPIIKDLDVVGPEDRHDSFFQKFWESGVGAAAIIFKNQKKDQIATKVDLEGNLENPQSSTLDAIWQVLRNAFIHALIPSIDHQISIKSVEAKSGKEDRNILQKIFSKDESTEDKEGKNKKAKEK